MSIDKLPISDQNYEVLHEMRDQVKGDHEILLATEASANHFEETQALLKNLHDVVFSVFPNIKLVFYDIGLTPAQRSAVEKHCRCTVTSIPFSKLPSHVSNLSCYAWKVVIIAAHYQQAEVLVWLDASIRIHNTTSFAAMVQTTKERGVQQRQGAFLNIQFTHPQTFEMFGDSPCAHHKVLQPGAMFGMYHREDLIKHTVMKPWLGCALEEQCICPVDRRHASRCDAKSPVLVGVCHRWEQSAMSIIMARLFREKYYYVFIKTDLLNVDRGDKLNYFQQLENRNKSSD